MLYNLYRPKDFTEVKGQEDVLITLKSSLSPRNSAMRISSPVIEAPAKRQ